MSDSQLFQLIGIALAVGGIAALYGSVGHGGASGYLAIMAILSFQPEVMKPCALMLNLIVAGIGAVNFIRAGHFRFRLLWPFAVTSIPMSYLGARLSISPKFYAFGLALTLIWAGIRLASTSPKSDEGFEAKPLPTGGMTLGMGALIGFVSGMIGVGGGIFLSPLFVLMRWANPKETSAVSAAFIWLNSAAGILGYFHSGVHWIEGWMIWVFAAAVGGTLGSHFGARNFSNVTLRRILSAVLLIAAAKSVLTAVK